MQTIPPLDSALAKRCDDIADPADETVDALVDAHIDLIQKYADCSARHDATVKAWNGMK